MDGSCNLVLYLGTRGGGAQLLLETVENLSSQSIDFLPVVSKSLSHGAKDSILRGAVEVTQVRNFRELWKNGYKFLIDCIVLGRQLRKHNRVRIVLVMIHPMDLVLIPILKALGNKLEIMLIVHEIQSRDNHWWPSKLITNLYLIFSGSVVALNEGTYRNLIDNHQCKRIYLSQLEHRNLFREISHSSGNPPYALCIGRNEPYKDLDLLMQAWKILGEDFMNLVIKGDGVPNLSMQNISSTDTWLSDEEFISQIINADVVILPYKSSTQSGVLSLAISCNRRIVITPVPELIAQAAGVGIVSESFSAISLANAIRESLNGLPDNSGTKNKTHIAFHELATQFFRGDI